jgi:hypothetical protein
MKNLLLSAGVLLAMLGFAPAVFADCTVTTDTGHATQIASVGYLSSIYNATSFVAGCSGTISTIDNYANVGSTGVSVTEYLYSDTSSHPGTLLATADTKAFTDGSCTLKTFTYGSPYTVTNGVTYWVVWSNGSGSSTDYSYLCGSATGGTGFTYRSTDGTTWVNSDQHEYLNLTIVTGGGGGGVDTISATSTLDQAQRNLAQGFWIYLACFFGVVWLLRKH